MSKKNKGPVFKSFDDLVFHFLFPKILKKTSNDKEEEYSSGTHIFHLKQAKKHGVPCIRKEIYGPKIPWMTWCFHNFEEAEEIFESKLRSRQLDPMHFSFSVDKEKVVIIKVTPNQTQRLFVRIRRKSEASTKFISQGSAG